MQDNERQLNEMLKLQQKNDLSSEEDEDQVSVYQAPASLSGFRKPIKNPFSDHSDSSDSSDEEKLGNTQVHNTMSPFPPKQPKTKSVLEQVQSTMKWNRQQETEVQILSKLEGQGMKDKKIRELASKYKSLNIVYEKEKTMRKKFEDQLNALLKTNEQSMRNSSMEKENNHNKSATLERSQVKSEKCMNSVCQQNEKKVMQFRLQSQNLKSQLNKAYRVISREIGENFNVDQVLNEQNAWKGRQQKIEKLKGRVRQLQEKLANNGVNVSHMSGFTQMSSATMRTNNNFNSTRTSTMAQNKRKEFDNLKIQVETLKSDNELLQGKIKSVTSRKLILENQVKELKSEFEKKKQILIEKSENDDKFIGLLKAENEKLKRDERVVTKVVYKDQKDNDENTKLKKQVERLKQYIAKTNSGKAQEKCINNSVEGGEKQEKIEIMFPPSQKSRKSIERPTSTKRVSQKDVSAMSATELVQPYPGTQTMTKLSREVSAQKKKELQNEHLKGNKYLKKLSAEEQNAIYQNWKSGKKIQ